ncbi:MAG: UDP-N-acetylglucosamine--N-acetylmuramyl-(pentapeptide) pyrophosphoryl-undecaprenol N-acetylglucosamine transferase, partial [Acidobacteriota bacterium]
MMEGNLAPKVKIEESPLAGLSPLRILFAGGGTGGHIYMAVALARRLGRIDPRHQFLFVGTPRGLEERILSPLGFEWTTIRVGGLNRVGWRQAARSLSEVPASLLASRRILAQFRPHLMVGLGGYSSGPVAVAARWMKVPSLLIEPNVEPGLTNRIIGRWADGIAVAFEETRQRLGGKALLTGIPVRDEFYRIRTPIRQEGPL